MNPTIDDLKIKYAKAKTVKSSDFIGQDIINISKLKKWEDRTSLDGTIWLGECCMWCNEKGFAEIITFKKL